LTEFRKLGIGRKLMNKSKDYAIRNKYSRIELSTSINNTNAQKLYSSLDYIRDKEYYNYDLEL
jgi:ribosomal protein S18 acetylase RimI-like enzyme